MKKQIMLICILQMIMIISCATPPTESQMSDIKEEVKEFQGLTKNDLYKKALNWVARAYNSANNVIQLKDEESGQIICKGIFYLQVLLNYAEYNYTLIIDIKDSKMRVRIENIAVGAIINSKKLSILIYPEESMYKYFSTLKADLYKTILSEKIKSDENW